MFKKILIAFDISAPAARAVEVAVELASQLNARIGLVHVVDSSRAFHPEIQVFDERLLDIQRLAGERAVQAGWSLLPVNLKAERMLLEGDPADRILACARDWSADLIVIGNDSRGRLAHFLLGSTADAVIRRASCPVITVRAEKNQQLSTCRSSSGHLSNSGANHANRSIGQP